MNTCELLSLIGLQLLGSEGGFIGLIGCLQIAVCCHALPFQHVSLNRSTCAYQVLTGSEEWACQSRVDGAAM